MQNQDIQIVPVQQQDYSQWEKYWLAYQNFYQVSLPFQVTKITWDRFFNEKNLCIVRLLNRANMF